MRTFISFDTEGRYNTIVVILPKGHPWTKISKTEGYALPFYDNGIINFMTNFEEIFNYAEDNRRIGDLEALSSKDNGKCYAKIWLTNDNGENKNFFDTYTRDCAHRLEKEIIMSVFPKEKTVFKNNIYD